VLLDVLFITGVVTVMDDCVDRGAVYADDGYCGASLKEFITFVALCFTLLCICNVVNRRG